MSVYILIHTRNGAAASVRARVARVPGVTRADAMQGLYDVIARAEGADLHETIRSIVSEIQAIEGVTGTITCPSASHERIWEMGMEPADLLGVGVPA